MQYISEMIVVTYKELWDKDDPGLVIEYPVGTTSRFSPSCFAKISGAKRVPPQLTPVLGNSRVSFSVGHRSSPINAISTPSATTRNTISKKSELFQVPIPP